MMNTFMDTNIYLSFYQYSNDDLEELKKLSILCSRNDCTLLINDQLISEYKRNRENKIHESLSNLVKQNLDLKFPHICEDYPEFIKMRDAQRKYSQAHDGVIEKIKKDVESMNLKADKTIAQLFLTSKRIKITEEIYEHAHKRVILGNPPGKKDSIGDAIHWEGLLSAIKKGEDIFFISDDSDFDSPLNKYKLNSFLEEEWSEKKDSKIHYFRSLSSFFTVHFPDISLESEIKKESLIEELSRSGNFATTHEKINQLSKFSGFTMTQINSIIAASISNTQILWIINDEDVKNFLFGLISGKESEIDQDYLHLLYENFGMITQPVDDNVPF